MGRRMDDERRYERRGDRKIKRKKRKISRMDMMIRKMRRMERKEKREGWIAALGMRDDSFSVSIRDANMMWDGHYCNTIQCSFV